LSILPTTIIGLLTQSDAAVDIPLPATKVQPILDVIFDCQAGNVWRDDSQIVVVAKASSHGISGEIDVSGVTHKGFYGVRGFDRWWDFGRNHKNVFRYAFSISPSGAATYYEISTDLRPTPVQNYICRKRN